MIDNVRSILRSYTPKQFLVRAAEEYLWWLIRSWPGVSGLYLRYLFLKATTKRLDGFCWISQGCTFSNSWGLSIGKGFAVNRNILVDAIGGIEIGDHAGIGPNSVVLSHEHSMLSKGWRDPAGYSRKPVAIGSNVWIGANCFVKAGVRIGDDSVVAACSNVVADVPPKTQVIGVPARPYAAVMREFVSEARARSRGDAR